MTSKLMNEDEGIIWSTANELHLLQVLVHHKPAGINKHFQMVIIQDKLSTLIPGITCQHIWGKLRTMYDLAAVDDREEHIPFNLEKKEFSLPRREFSGIMRELQKEQRDRPAESSTQKAPSSNTQKAPRTSNSSRNPATKTVTESSRTKTTSISETSRQKTISVSEVSKPRATSVSESFKPRAASVSESSKPRATSGSESPRPKTLNATEASKLPSTPLESPAEMAKKINAYKEKEKETLKGVKTNEAVKASTEKIVNKQEDSLKSSAKRPERATRSTPSTTPASKRRKT